MNSATTATSSTTRRAGLLAMFAALGSVLSLVSLVGPTWLFSPAQPAAGIPEMSFSFNALSDATSISPSTVQSSYFGWLGWTLVVITIVLAAASILTRATLVAVVEGVVALATLVVTVFAVKGPLTWGGFYDALPNMRIGGYLIIVGLLLIIIHAAAMSSRSRS